MPSSACDWYKACLGVHEHIEWVVALAAVEEGPQHSALIGLTGGEAAASPLLTATAAAVFIKSHQQLEVWTVQSAPAGITN